MMSVEEIVKSFNELERNKVLNRVNEYFSHLDQQVIDESYEIDELLYEDDIDRVEHYKK